MRNHRTVLDDPNRQTKHSTIDNFKKKLNAVSEMIDGSEHHSHSEMNFRLRCEVSYRPLNAEEGQLRVSLDKLIEQGLRIHEETVPQMNCWPTPQCDQPVAEHIFTMGRKVIEWLSPYAELRKTAKMHKEYSNRVMQWIDAMLIHAQCLAGMSGVRMVSQFNQWIKNDKAFDPTHYRVLLVAHQSNKDMQLLLSGVLPNEQRCRHFLAAMRTKFDMEASKEMDLVGQAVHSSIRFDDIVELAKDQGLANEVRSIREDNNMLEFRVGMEPTEEQSNLRRRTMPVGLMNSQLSCYVNSVVQMIKHFPLLNDLFLSGDWLVSPRRSSTQDVARHNILAKLRDLIVELETTNLSRASSHLLQHVLVTQHLPFMGGGQQDCAETWNVVQDAITHYGHIPSVNRVIEALEHRRVNKIFCENCGVQVDTIFSEELMFILLLRQLAQGEVASLEQLLAKQFPIEDEVDHRSDCPNCGEIRNTIHRLEVRKFPALMVVQVLRFSSLDQKDSRPVRLPQCFETQNDLKRTKKFSLRSFAVHVGSTMKEGHYYSVCRDMTNPNLWFKCNDTRMLRHNRFPSDLARNWCLAFCENVPLDVNGDMVQAVERISEV